MFFEKNLINLNMHFDDSNQALTFLAKKMVDLGYASDCYIERILERENLFPTGLVVGGVGVAIPHTDGKFVKENKVSIMTLDKALTFREMVGLEDVSVKVIFMLTLKDANYHLDILQKLLNFMQNKELMKKLVNSNNEDQVLKIFEKELQDKGELGC